MSAAYLKADRAHTTDWIRETNTATVFVGGGFCGALSNLSGTVVVVVVAHCHRSVDHPELQVVLTTIATRVDI